MGESAATTRSSPGPFWSDREPSLFRWWTRRRRPLPDFLILGGQRCGTTSLHHQLERIRGLSPAPVKEVHYFDLRYQQGVDWYRAHFPLPLFRRAPVTGESTPYYLFHPAVPERVRQLLPRAKLIVLLRNPVDRAYSHYHHAVRYGLEDAPTFEEALSREERRLEGEEERLLEDAGYRSISHCHHSYLARGVYVRQLRAWRERFEEEQFLILRSEDLFASPGPTVERVLAFLGVAARGPRQLMHFNRAANSPMPEAARARLVSYFRPHNLELERYLGVDLGWDR